MQEYVKPTPYTCKECGMEDTKHSEYTCFNISIPPKKLIEYELCFTCAFWLEKIPIRDLPEVARIEGKHYMIGSQDAKVPSHCRGYGGSRFTILFDDGRKVSTVDLWHQGTIPDRFKARLPDNATFMIETKEIS